MKENDTQMKHGYLKYMYVIFPHGAHRTSLPSHYMIVTQFQYILIISLHEDLQHTNEALMYDNLHISQHRWVLINIFYAQQMFKL